MSRPALWSIQFDMSLPCLLGEIYAHIYSTLSGRSTNMVRLGGKWRHYDTVRLEYRPESLIRRKALEALGQTGKPRTLYLGPRSERFRIRCEGATLGRGLVCGPENAI